MSSIELAQQARIENHLNELTRHKNAVMTNADFIRALLNDGYLPACRAVPKAKDPTRTQINRWSNQEQVDNAKKRAKAGTKIEYLMERDGTFYELSKICFDFAVSLKGAEFAAPEQRTFVLFNYQQPFRSNETKPYCTVYKEMADNREQRIKSLMDCDFPYAKTVWIGTARTQEEAYRLAGK